MGINFNDWGGLDGHYVICDSRQRAQREGGFGHGGRRFAFGAAAYVLATAKALEGRPLFDDTPPSSPCEVAHAWDQCAFLEAVKCAPTRPAGEPYDTMWSNCIDLLLLDEFELLRPAVVLALGRTRLRDHVRPLLREKAGLTYGVHNGFERDTFSLRCGERVTLMSLNHTSRANIWQRSYAALQQSLREWPLLARPPR